MLADDLRRPAGGAGADGVSFQNRHPNSSLRQLEGGAAPHDAAADDDGVVGLCHDLPSLLERVLPVTLHGKP